MAPMTRAAAAALSILLAWVAPPERSRRREIQPSTASSPSGTSRTRRVRRRRRPEWPLHLPKRLRYGEPRL
jgi:hypothetical protein